MSATVLDIAEVGESFGHIGAVWALVDNLFPQESEQLRAVLFSLDDEARERVVEHVQDALVDIRDWAGDLIAVFEEAGRE